MQELSPDGSSHHPYRHPMLQKAINLTWFRDKDDDGVVFHEYFSPLSVPAIAFILTVVRVVFMNDGPRILTNVIRPSAASMSGRMAHGRILSGAESSSKPRTSHTSAHSMTSGNTGLPKAQTCLITSEVISSRKHGRSSIYLAYASSGHSFADAQLGHQKTCRCPACAHHGVRKIFPRRPGRCTQRRSSPVPGSKNQHFGRLGGMIAQSQMTIYFSSCLPLDPDISVSTSFCTAFCSSIPYYSDCL